MFCFPLRGSKNIVTTVTPLPLPMFANDLAGDDQDDDGVTKVTMCRGSGTGAVTMPPDRVTMPVTLGMCAKLLLRQDK